MTIKYLSLFSGIGAFEKALKNLEIPFELIGYSEVDKYASKSYSEIHDVSEKLNLGDITKINGTKLPEVDLITYGFPCQDISLAGRQKGFINKDGSKTRSGLFFDALRIIEEVKPKVAIAENVKNLTSKKFKEEFELVLKSLEDAGYNNYYKVLNAKDYGVPQNRERVFIVSIRKDADNKIFKFPKPYELKLRLKDMLEEEVDEKYYLSQKQVDRIRFTTYHSGARRIQEKDWCDTLCARDYKDPKCVKVEQIGKYDTPTRKNYTKNTEPERLFGVFDKEKVNNKGNVTIQKHQAGSVWNKEKISPTLDTAQGGYRQPMIVDDTVVSAAMRGRYNQEGEIDQQIEVSNNEYSHAITTVQKDSIVMSNLRIRKLTPRECFRLMGFTDADFDKCTCSNTQLYKQAGNSIVVDVLEELFCMMFDEDGNFYV